MIILKSKKQEKSWEADLSSDLISPLQFTRFLYFFVTKILMIVMIIMMILYTSLAFSMLGIYICIH